MPNAVLHSPADSWTIGGMLCFRHQPVVCDLLPISSNADLSGHLVPFAGSEMSSTEASGSDKDSAGSDSADGGGGGGGGASAEREERSNEQAEQQMAHHGILRAAQSLLDAETDTLAELLADNPGYRLKVVMNAGLVSQMSIPYEFVQHDETSSNCWRTTPAAASRRRCC